MANLAWTLFEEFTFLRKIGTYSDLDPNKDKKKLLQGYLAGLDKRKVFGRNMEKEAIRKYAIAQLEAL